MKYIAALIAVVVVGGLLINFVNDTDYVENEPITVVEEVHPEWATDQEAVEAAQAVIRRKELEAELEAVTADFEALEARKTELEKLLGQFWTNTSNIKAHIRQVFPEDSSTAIAIADCESRLNPNAYNGNNNNGSTDGGLWQINSIHDAELERLGLDKYDPEDATQFARILYDRNGGWGDWVCYWKDLHLAHL